MTIKIAELRDRYFEWEFLPEGADIYNWIRSNLYVYDSDSCGSSDHYFVYGRDGVFEYYTVHHEWYWINYGKEDSHLVNDFTFEEITEAEARTKVKNWMIT